VWWAASFKQDKVFGCGYFDDSGDVKDKPVLFYRLEGKCDQTGLWTITKTYESVSEYSVVYEGRFENEKFQGSWTNAAAGSFGKFLAQKASFEHKSEDIILVCRQCHSLVSPGALRGGDGTCSFCGDPGKNTAIQFALFIWYKKRFNFSFYLRGKNGILRGGATSRG
jgi:hypothetical protein